MDLTVSTPPSPLWDDAQLLNQEHASGPGKATRSRATRACESCRLLKIRCISSHDVDIHPCENCEKSGKTCVVVPLVRTRRRKRTDARVSELESEVRALTSLLRQSADGNHGETQSSEQPRAVATLEANFQPPIISWAASGISPASVSSSNLIPSNLASLSSNFNAPPHESRADSYSLPHFTIATQDSHLRQGQELLTAGVTSSFVERQQQDVIDRGLLTWAVALKLFIRYQTELAYCYPIVPLSSVDDVAKFRRTKPVLFLATMNAAAATSSDQLRDALHDELLKMYATCVMVQGIKSLELLQAMLVTVAWYRPCGSYKDTKYLQLTQAASLMAHELGLGKPCAGNRMHNAEKDGRDCDISGFQIYDHPQANIQSLYSEDVECHRTLLASYVQSSSKYLLSHFSTVPPVPTQVAASLEVLKSSSETSYLDKDIAVWARMQLLTQEARLSLGGDDSERRVRITDAHLQRALIAFENQLCTLLRDKESSPSGGEAFIKTDWQVLTLIECLEIGFQANILHLNEIALHEDYDPKDFHPPYSLDSGQSETVLTVGVAYINGIMKCVSSSHKLLDRILEIDRPTLISMPSVTFVRAMYALVVLFKIWLLVVSANHPLAALLDQGQLCLSGYIDRVRQLLSSLSYELGFQGANKYLDIVRRVEISHQTVLHDLRLDNRHLADETTVQNGTTARNAPGPYTGRTDGDFIPQFSTPVLSSSENFASGTSDSFFSAALPGSYVVEGLVDDLPGGPDFASITENSHGHDQNLWSQDLY